jgi:hypothetical protein
MKPFIRPFVPLASSSDTSPAGSIVSPLHRSPTCFRIAEALRYISSTFSGGTNIIKALNLEVYAYLHGRVEIEGVSTITLKDVFFPAQPPYLYATAKETTMTLLQRGGSSSLFFPETLKAVLVRAVVQVTPNSTTKQPSAFLTETLPLPPMLNHLASKCTFTALKIEQTDWDEIQRVKDILDEKSSQESTSAGKTTPLTQGNASGLGKQKNRPALSASPD